MILSRTLVLIFSNFYPWNFLSTDSWCLIMSLWHLSTIFIQYSVKTSLLRFLRLMQVVNCFWTAYIFWSQWIDFRKKPCDRESLWMNFLTIVLALASCVFFMPVSEPPKALHENTIDLVISIFVIFSRALKSFLNRSFSRFLSNLKTASDSGLKLYLFFSLWVIDCLYIFLMTKPWMRLAIWSYLAILSFLSMIILRR